MSFRFMRIIVFFDLPTLTSKDRREYSKFRKFLIKSGFIMLQESVYSKIALNAIATSTITDNIRRNKPKSGLVQLMKITENQYSKMEFIIGESHSDVIDSTERLVIL